MDLQDVGTHCLPHDQVPTELGGVTDAIEKWFNDWSERQSNKRSLLQGQQDLGGETNAQERPAKRLRDEQTQAPPSLSLHFSFKFPSPDECNGMSSAWNFDSARVTFRQNQLDRRMAQAKNRNITQKEKSLYVDSCSSDDHVKRESDDDRPAVVSSDIDLKPFQVVSRFHQRDDVCHDAVELSGSEKVNCHERRDSFDECIMELHGLEGLDAATLKYTVQQEDNESNASLSADASLSLALARVITEQNPAGKADPWENGALTAKLDKTDTSKYEASPSTFKSPTCNTDECNGLSSKLTFDPNDALLMLRQQYEDAYSAHAKRESNEDISAVGSSSYLQQNIRHELSDTDAFEVTSGSEKECCHERRDSFDDCIMDLPGLEGL